VQKVAQVGITQASAVQVMRLALLYALLDMREAATIKLETISWERCVCVPPGGGAALRRACYNTHQAMHQPRRVVRAPISPEGRTMPQRPLGSWLSESQRKEIFAALVAAQDLQMTVAESRRMVCEQFGLTEEQVRQIEREGMDRGWPPL
jgi:hypothetical protein